MTANFSAWSNLSMSRKLAILDDSLQSTDLVYESATMSSASAPPTLDTATQSGGGAVSGVNMTSLVMSVCALTSCGLASNYAYSSYRKWQRKQPKEVKTAEEEKESASLATDLLSGLRSVYSSFTKETATHEVKHTLDPNVFEGHQEVVAKHQKLLNSIKTNMARAGLEFSADDAQMLRTTVEQLNEKFLVSIVGEFNSGKSAFINALLGGRFVQEGILPTTDFITKITYDEHESCTRNSAQNLMEVKLPVPWLKDVTLVDTPGTNALFELGHQAITEKFLPHSDLVLFVTSAERPLTESERQIIKRVHGWGRKIVVVVNKIDLRTEEEREQLLDYVRSNIDEIVPGTEVPIFPLSARLALMAKIQSLYQQDTEQAPWQELWVASNIGSVERYIFHSLDDQQKMRVKLQGPLSVAGHFLAQYDAKLQDHSSQLRKEQALLTAVDSLIDNDLKALCKDFKNMHVEQFEASFSRLMDRMEDFVDHHISFGSFFHFVMQPKAVQNTFREEVCQDFQSEIEGLSVKLTDWLTEVRSRLVESVMRELGSVTDRSTTVQNVWKNLRVAPVVLGQDHQLELRQFREAIRSIIEKFTSDEKHSRALTDSVQNSILQIVAVEVCACLTGLLWYSSFSTWLQNRNGVGPAAKLYTLLAGSETSVAKELAKPLPMLLLLAGAGLMAVSGLNILQYRRAAVKRKLGREAMMCQERLVHKLDSVVQEKARKTVADTMLWLQPFVQAIKTEHDRIEEMKAVVEGWHEEVGEIQTMIGTVTEKMQSKAETEEEGPYPVSKPMAYPNAIPMGPAPRGLSLSRTKSIQNAPPSYPLESPRYAPSAPLYPNLSERRSSIGSPTPSKSQSKHFNFQPSAQLARQGTPVHYTPYPPVYQPSPQSMPPPQLVSSASLPSVSPALSVSSRPTLSPQLSAPTVASSASVSEAAVPPQPPAVTEPSPEPKAVRKPVLLTAV